MCGIPREVTVGGLNGYLDGAEPAANHAGEAAQPGRLHLGEEPLVDPVIGRTRQVPGIGLDTVAGRKDSVGKAVDQPVPSFG